MSTNEAEEPAIHRAARLGDLQALEQLIAEGVPIDTPFSWETYSGSSSASLIKGMVSGDPMI